MDHLRAKMQARAQKKQKRTNTMAAKVQELMDTPSTKRQRVHSPADVREKELTALVDKIKS
eukprot:3993821-Karenia_brevis.AAC.1